MVEISIILLRFAITFILSFLFGIERHRAHKPVGFGTFIFVAVGSCGLAVIAIDLGMQNPLPLLGAIVTGIGFLGAGALIKTADKIFGFTTAASIWVFAIFGLLIGIGEYLVGILVYASVWIIVFFDRLFQKKGIGSYQKKIVVNTNKIINEKEIKNQLLLCVKKCKLISIELDKKNKKISATYLIEGTKEDISMIPDKLFGKEWFDSFKVE